MILDIIFAVLMILALIRGFQRGLIVGLFSLIAIFIGLAAAIKLSAVVAGWIGKNVKISEQWLPIIAFAIVFLVVVLLVRLGANAISKMVKAMMLGWVDRIGGMIFYVAMYITIYSVLLFYAEQVKLVTPEITKKSVTYQYVKPWGPRAIDAFGKVIPVFKDMFADLEEFFGHVSKNIPEKTSR